MIKKKGGAGFAVGLAIHEVIEAIALDRRAILPVSSRADGCYGIRDVACRCRRSSAAAASWRRTRSSSGPRKCRRCARAARCCDKRSTPCSAELGSRNAKSRSRQRMPAWLDEPLTISDQ